MFKWLMMGSIRKGKVYGGEIMKKYCIHVSRIIEVEDINGVETFTKIDYVTQEVIGYYLVTKDKEQYQIDEKTYKKIVNDKELDFEELMNL